MIDLIFALKNLAHLATDLLEKAYGLVGPLAPALSILGALEGILLAFAVTLVVGTRSGLLAPEQIRAEGTFVARVKDLNGMLASVAIVTGFIGTYWGLMDDMLPGLSKIVEGEAGPEVTSSLLAGLSTAFASSIAGLALGGIAGSVNQFLLDLATPLKHGQGDQQDGGSLSDESGEISPSARDAPPRDAQTEQDAPTGEEPQQNGWTRETSSPSGGSLAPPSKEPSPKETGGF